MLLRYLRYCGAESYSFPLSLRLPQPLCTRLKPPQWTWYIYFGYNYYYRIIVPVRLTPEISVYWQQTLSESTLSALLHGSVTSWLLWVRLLTDCTTTPPVPPPTPPIHNSLHYGVVLRMRSIHSNPADEKKTSTGEIVGSQHFWSIWDMDWVRPSKGLHTIYLPSVQYSFKCKLLTYKVLHMRKEYIIFSHSITQFFNFHNPNPNFESCQIKTGSKYELVEFNSLSCT